MPIYTLRRSARVALPIDECWRFFSDPRNLSRITPPQLGFRVLSDLPAAMYPGLMIEYSVAPILGIRMRWLTEITQVRAPHFFVDEQRIGPYALWHHEHSFRAVSEHETHVDDLVHYVPPFGPIGALINRVAIAPQLARIFEYRAQHVATLGA